MPLLSRNKSLPGSAARQSTAASAKQPQPLVCESPLFGLRRQLPVSSCGVSQEATVGTARQSPSTHHQNQNQNQRQSVSAKSSTSTSPAAFKGRYGDLHSSASSCTTTSASTTNTNTSTADTLVSIPKQITRQQIHYAFSIMDTNSDGLIDLRDLSQMLANLGVPIDEAILSHVMSTVSKRAAAAAAATTSGDHRISEQEFLHWIGNFIQVSDLPDASNQQLAAGARRSARANEPSAAAAAAGGQRRAHTAVARSSSTSAPASSSSSSLLAQSIEAQELVGQQMRQRRGSGSGLALMRSLSSQSTASSASSTSATADSQHKTDSNRRSTGATSGDHQHQQEQQAELQQEARDDLKAAFCVFDLDGDGYITIDEVQQGLKLLGESWSQAELNQLLFNKCDPNNNTGGGGGGNTGSGVIKGAKSSSRRMDLSLAKQQQQQQQQQLQQQQQRISIEDFVKLLL